MARKENNQSKNTPFPQRLPTAGSFDKVVNSIDGLRDRVQGFTVEQVSEADEKLRTISLGLSELQRRLRVLCQMKDRVNRLKENIQGAQAQSLEESRSTIEAEPMPDHAIPHVENLLKLRQVIKLIKVTQNVSVTLTPRDQDVQPPVIFEPFEIVSKGPKTSMTCELPLPEQSLTEAQKHEENIVASTESPEKSEEVYDRDQLEEADEGQFFSNEAADAPQSAETVGSIPIENLPIDNLHLDSINATEYPQLNRSFPMDEVPAASDQARTEVSEDADFDHRLLDDLIKNYGEFSIMPSSPAGAKVHQERKNGDPIPTLRTDSAIAVPLARQPSFPLQRKDGELDRKLKKLIKDYGEYDLYSRQTPLKLKTGVIAAFLLLTLVFSGFYFFSSPKSAITPSVSSASQSQNDSAAPSKETTPSVETSKGEASSGSNGDALKAIDSGAAHNSPNKVATKKTK
jgi:hypothetical protein